MNNYYTLLVLVLLLVFTASLTDGCHHHSSCAWNECCIRQGVNLGVSRGGCGLGPSPLICILAHILAGPHCSRLKTLSPHLWIISFFTKFGDFLGNFENNLSLPMVCPCQSACETTYDLSFNFWVKQVYLKTTYILHIFFKGIFFHSIILFLQNCQKSFNAVFSCM